MKILFHIGHHKTGTTWLQNYFFPSHDGLKLISLPSEPWNDNLLKYLIRTPAGKYDPGECRSIFEKAIENEDRDRVFVISAERLSGHPYSGGFDRFRIADRIHSAFPDANILCVVRNQIDMISSAYKLLLEEGYAGSIQALLKLKHWKGVGFDLSFYEYNLTAQKYVSLFGSSNVLITPYEKMRVDIEGYLTDICEFLGVNFSPLDSRIYSKNANIGLPNRAIPVAKLLNRFRRTELNPFPAFHVNGGAYADEGLQGWLVKQIRKLPPSKDDILSSDLKEMLRSYYSEPNRRLADYMKNDAKYLIDKMNGTA